MRGGVNLGASKPGGRGAQLTERDLGILEFVTRCGAVTMEQVQAYAFGGTDGGTDSAPASDSAVYRRLRQLRELGLIKHERILFDKPGIYRTTEPGARYADVGLPPARVDLSRLYHHLEVVDLFLAISRKIDYLHYWATEREIRQEVLNLGRSGSGKMSSGNKTGRIPDGLLITRYGERVAIELELSQKRTDDYRRILQGYAKHQRQRIEQPEDDDPKAHLSDYVHSGGKLDGVIFYIRSAKALERVKKVAQEVLKQHREPSKLYFWVLQADEITVPTLGKYDDQLQRDQKAYEKAKDTHQKKKESYLARLELTENEAIEALEEAYERKNEGRHRIFHRALNEEEEEQAKEQALKEKRERESREYPEFKDSVT